MLVRCNFRSLPTMIVGAADKRRCRLVARKSLPGMIVGITGSQTDKGSTMRKKRKYLELTLEEGLVDAVDYVAELLSTTRRKIVRESLIERLRKEGVDLLRPRRY